MTKLTNKLILAVLILSPLVYLALVWSSLPDEVPLHFGINGEPDRWGSKITLIYLPGLMPLGMYLLMKVIPVIDPKNSIQKMGNKYNTLLMFIVGFMTALAFFIISLAQGNGMSLLPMLPALIGVFFIVLGNYMQSIKPNYFLGIRTPWTLESELVWRKTHRLGGRLFIGGGALMVLVAFTMKGVVMFATYLSIVVLLTMTTVIYSYVEYKKLPG